MRKITMNRRIDINHKTIFFITGFIGLLWALYQIREVIVLLFIAIIFMSALSPIIEFSQKLKLPKALAIAVVYILVLGILITLVTFVFTPLLSQTGNLVTNLPETADKLLPANGPIDRSVIQQELGRFSQNAVEFSLTIFSNFLAFISVAVLTFYLLLERDNLDRLLAQFFIGREERIKLLTRKIEEKLGSWLRGQIALSFIIGVAAYIALALIDVPYALPLAILAGLMEVVPVIGPIISAIPAIAIAYTVSPVAALITLGAYFLIQQLENHLIVPQVMKKAVGLNPLIVILAVAIGGKLLGISGALLAVPIAVVIQIFTEDILNQ
jgi:predicted PurR-regulated permease PerM